MIALCAFILLACLVVDTLNAESSVIHKHKATLQAQEHEMNGFTFVPSNRDSKNWTESRHFKLNFESEKQNKHRVISCPDLCKCTTTLANCSANYGRLSFVPALPAGINELIFSLNNLTAITANNFFSNVSNITYLDLSSNGLTFVLEGVFKLLTNLRTLILSFNNLNYGILRQIFSLEGLQRLEVAQCGLGPIPNAFFSRKSLRNLKYLDMQNNTLQTINLTVFSPLSKLTDLNLGFCQISTFIPDTLRSLIHLNLDYNGISTFPSCNNVMSFFPRLMDLHLRGNSLSHIDKVCLPLLQGLDLSYNHFQTISSYMLDESRFPSLTVLNISFSTDTQLNLRIDAYAFANPSLKTLSLWNSELEFAKDDVVHPDAFANCTALRRLILQSNIFRGVSDAKFHRLFSQLPSLAMLYLPYTEIGYVTKDTFKGLYSLQRLYLYGNSITSIPDGAFDHLTNLTDLILSNNILSVVRETTFSAAMLKRLHRLDLSGNPFTCSCQIMWLRRCLIESPALFSRSKNNYTCSNIPNMNISSFYLSDQACLFDRDMEILTVISICLLISTLTLIASFYRYRWHIRLILYEAFRGRTNARRQHLLTGSFQYDIFVSYAAEDLKWVRDHLLPELEGRLGLRICVHQRDFLPGENIVDNIIVNLQTSRKVILVFSKHFARSQWCQFELALCLQYVMDHDDVLIVVCLPHLSSRDLTGSMLAVLKTTTYIQWEDDGDATVSFWGRTEIALNEIISLRIQ